MRQFNRIAGFVAVSFVLVFLGKVSKVSLYTAYFKTLADVEVRNSTAHDHGDTQYEAVAPGRVIQELVTAAGGSAVTTAYEWSSPVFAASTPISANAPATESFGLRCFMEVAPRAPGA